MILQDGAKCLDKRPTPAFFGSQMGGFRPIQVVEQMVCRFSRSQGQKADLFSVSLGLPGLEVFRVERRRSIHVWAQPAERPACIHCNGSDLRIKATHPRTLKHTRQANQVMVLHLSVPKYHCTGCNRYFRHRFAGIRPRMRATEAYRLEVFEAHDGGISQRKLSLTHQVSCATVERWYQHHIKRRISEMSGRSCPQVLGIDEHFFTRKQGFATTLVDLKNHKVFDVVLGRSRCLSSLLSCDSNIF